MNINFLIYVYIHELFHKNASWKIRRKIRQKWILMFLIQSDEFYLFWVINFLRHLWSCCITMMEQVGYYIFADKGCEIKIRYEYRIYDFTVEINFYEGDLANLLDLTGYSTLKDMEFEVYMEVLRDNGRIEGQIIILPDIIMNSTANKLRNNYSLYEKPYYISSN